MNQEPYTNEPTQEEISYEGASAKKESKSLLSSVFEMVEMFCISLFVVMLLFSFVFRLCRVDGSSMENTLHENEMLLVSSFAYTPKQDDVIVFHMTKPTLGLEKPLVKRVIATEGQKVEIDFKNLTITVDGILYADTHKVLKDFNNNEIGFYYLTADHHYDAQKGFFSATVPEGCVFVLGDNRNNSRDSRELAVGFIDERSILGKVIFRLSPFTYMD